MVERDDSTSTTDVVAIETLTPSEQRWVAFPRYIFLSSLAIGLTLSCPGNTHLWEQSTDSDSSFLVLRKRKVIELIFVYALILLGFWIVHKSDPGFISPETLQCFTVSDSTEMEEEAQHHLRSIYDRADESSMVEMIPLNRGDSHILSEATEVLGPENAVRTSFLFRRSKYCDTCQVQPLIRSHHCKICQHCVATFDHHCIFMGVCIGERNHARFWFFLLCQAIGFYLCCRIVGSSALGWTTLMFPPAQNHPLSIPSQAAATNWFDPWRVILAEFFLYPLNLVAWVMLGLHTFFLLCNVTTFEFTKGPRHIDYLQGTEDMDFPFSQGCVGNIRLCCTGDAGCHSPIACARHEKNHWKPKLWQKPGKIIRDSPDWWNHPWQNKYWSCC